MSYLGFRGSILHTELLIFYFIVIVVKISLNTKKKILNRIYKILIIGINNNINYYYFY